MAEVLRAEYVGREVASGFAGANPGNAFGGQRGAVSQGGGRGLEALGTTSGTHRLDKDRRPGHTRRGFRTLQDAVRVPTALRNASPSAFSPCPSPLYWGLLLTLSASLS